MYIANLFFIQRSTINWVYIFYLRFSMKLSQNATFSFFAFNIILFEKNKSRSLIIFVKKFILCFFRYVPIIGNGTSADRIDIG